jgi:hypothetical protein
VINFDKLSKRQLAVFEQISMNNDKGHPVSALNALYRNGYIRMHGTAPIRYSVPVSVHTAWRQWCAKQQTEKGQE